MQVLVQMRLDTNEPSLTGYVVGDARNRVPEARIRDYDNNIDLYRPLSIGEQEIASSGVAQLFLARRGVLDVRGGYVRGWYDQDALEAGARAVTHVRELHLNVAGKIGDEERFGGVARPDGSSTVFRKIVEAPAGIPAVPNPTVNVSAASDPIGAATEAAASLVPETEPAKEYMFVLKTAGGPVIDHREGHVVDDEGEFAEGKLDGNLRFRKKIYGRLSSDALSGITASISAAGTGSDTYEEQIDENGNWYVGLPPTATRGIKFEIPGGKFEFKSGIASSSLVMDGVEQTFKLAATLNGEVRGESGMKIHSAKVKVGQTYAAVNKVYATLTKKAAQLTLHGGLSATQIANSVLHTADASANTALAVIHAAVCACPLTPGVLVGLLGMAHSVIPVAMRAANSVMKLAKGGLSGAYVGSQDTHESNTVSISS
jgi:hypothetical protein